MKTVQVDDTNWQALMTLKISGKKTNLNDVIGELLKKAKRDQTNDATA